MTYAETAPAWLAAGFGPLPLPAGAKYPPPAGWTGADAPMPSAADVAAWSEDQPGANVALRLPPDVIALDVDDYAGRPGWATLCEHAARLGALPPTWRITARDDGRSGHLLFHLPAGATSEAFVAELVGGGVDVLRAGHRYSIAPGSVHPSGARYAMRDPDDAPTEKVPAVGDLPVLPVAWVESLRRRLAPQVGTASTYNTGRERADLTDAERRRLDRYTEDVIRREVGRLQACAAAATTGGVSYTGPAWQATTFEVACCLLELGNAPWSPLTPDRAAELVAEHAPRDAGFGAAEVGKALRSARSTVGDKARAVPVDRTPPTTVGNGPVGPFEDPTGGAWAAGPAAGQAGPQTGGGQRVDQDGDGGGKAPSVATQLVRLAEELFTIGQSDEGEPFALPRTGPRLVTMFRGGRDGLRERLARGFYERTGKAAGQAALADALTVLTGAARQVEPRPLALRVAETAAGYLLDLGDLTGRTIEVTSVGWSVGADSGDVLFRRTALTGALPTPTRGGTLAELFELVNVAPEDQAVVAAVLVASLIPGIPHPVTFLIGEQGAGKSSAMRALTGLLDPSPVQLRKPPRDVEAWVTAAAGSWAVAVDNVSGLPDWWSDSLCRAATGDGDVRRQLYSDGDLFVFAFRRCVWLNGIDLPGIRDDLADRAVTLRLAPLAGRRRTDAELTARWSEAHPRILGGLLDLAVLVLAELPRVHLEDPPRMIDFARVLAAVDRVIGSDGLSRYARLADELAADLVAGDPVLAALTDAVRVPWEGTAAQLLTTLDAGRWAFEARPREWPRNARALSTLLRRRAPSLRSVGWSVDDLGRGGRDKTVRFRLVPPAGQGLS